MTQKLPPIIVGVGLTDESEFVLERVANLSGDTDRLIAVHAERRLAWPSSLDSERIANQPRVKTRKEVQRSMEALCAQFDISNYLVRDGTPAKVLHEAAREYGARVIAIGTHGYLGWRALIGETANATLHGAPCDVLAILTKDVSTPKITPIKKILIAIDLTDDSNHVLQRGTEIAERHGASMVLVTVIKAFDPESLTKDRLSKSQLQVEDQSLQSLQNFAAAFNIPAFHVLHGAIADEIHTAVEAYQTDLVVMGSHARHGLQLILGSTPSDVLRGLNCDLMAVLV